jgi:hypothetical protein
LSWAVVILTGAAGQGKKIAGVGNVLAWVYPVRLRCDFLEKNPGGSPNRAVGFFLVARQTNTLAFSSFRVVA